MNTYSTHQFNYQLWMLPAFLNAPRPFYTPCTFYPHVLTPQLHTPALPFPASTQAADVLGLSPRGGEVEPSPVTLQTGGKSQFPKVRDSPATKPEGRISEIKKSNRPLTYLTEKAYYLKQKLKQKPNSCLRILRKRQRCKGVKFNNSGQGEQTDKMAVRSTRPARNRVPIFKDSEKEQRVRRRIKIKLGRENLKSQAQIPRQIWKTAQLNEFRRVKHEDLMLRNFTQY